MSPPTLEELLGYRALAAGLSLRSPRHARARLAGGHRALQRGRGLEFQEVRPYVEGDDPRSIDWRVTARRGRPHTRLYREERERPVWLLVDLGAGMYFGTRRQLKSQLVVRTAALLAWMAVAGADRIGAVITGSSTRKVLPPRGRDAGVLPLLPALLEMQPSAPAATAPGTMAAGLSTLTPLVHPGSLIVVLSDFAEGSFTQAPQWAGLGSHNDCHLMWITDPLEAQGLPDGRFRIGYPGRPQVFDGAQTRDSWRACFGERRLRVEQLARRIASPLTQLSTAQQAQDVLKPLFLGSRAA